MPLKLSSKFDRRYDPAVPISASELQATSVEEFLSLLRDLLKRSGVTRKRLAERSGIPQSTVYHLLNPKNTSLPTKLEQIQALVIACGLARNEVERVTQLWIELRNRPAVANVDIDKPADAVDQGQLDEFHGIFATFPSLWRRGAEHWRNCLFQAMASALALGTIMGLLMITPNTPSRYFLILPVVLAWYAVSLNQQSRRRRRKARTPVVVVERRVYSDGSFRFTEVERRVDPPDFPTCTGGDSFRW